MTECFLLWILCSASGGVEDQAADDVMEDDDRLADIVVEDPNTEPMETDQNETKDPEDKEDPEEAVMRRIEEAAREKHKKQTNPPCPKSPLRKSTRNKQT
jgi:hypothetical protein